MASEIRVNTFKNRSGLGTVSINDTGASFSGVVTATSFTGNLTGNVTSSSTSTFTNGLNVTGGSVGIGTDNPARVLHTSGNLVRFDNNASAGIILVDHQNSKNFRVVTNTVNSHSFSIEDMGSSVSGAGTARLLIDSSGNVQIANGNLVFSTSGTGIDFSATANSSGTTTSELLDDYEEGNFTPSFSGGSGTPNSMCRLGRYVKIGRVVYITINATSVCGGNGATFTEITGLPYAATQTGGETKFQMAAFYQRDNDNSTLSGAIVSTYAGVFQNTSTLQMSSTVTIPSNNKSYHLRMTYYTN